MSFDKQAVLDHITQQVGPVAAEQAAQMLPDQVDHVQHSELLQQLGINPQQMASQLMGQRDGGYGDQSQQGGYGDQGDDRDDRGGA